MMPHPVIFDRRLLRVRLARAAAIGPVTFLLDRVADDIAERLSAVLRSFDIAVDLGTPTDAVRRAIAGRVGTIAAVVADEEALPFRDASLDLAEPGPSERTAVATRPAPRA